MKKMLMVLACFYAASIKAGPSIDIGSVYDYLDGAKSSYLKRVFNGGESTAFVRINIYEIIFDSNGVPTEVALDSGAAHRKGLVASPARLIIPANGMQSSRLLYVGDRDRERYYRVRFLPVIPEHEDQFELSAAERDAYKDSMSAGVNVLAGYGSIFFVRPKNTIYNSIIQNSVADYNVINSGNSTIELNDFKDCLKSSEQECLSPRRHIIRPGGNFRFSKNKERIYSFKLVEGDSVKVMEVIK